MTMILNVSIYLISVAVVAYGQGIYMEYLGDMFGIELHTAPISSIVVGLILTVVIILFNFLIIYRKIAEISRKRC